MPSSAGRVRAVSARVRESCGVHEDLLYGPAVAAKRGRRHARVRLGSPIAVHLRRYKERGARVTCCAARERAACGRARCTRWAVAQRALQAGRIKSRVLADLQRRLRVNPRPLWGDYSLRPSPTSRRRVVSLPPWSIGLPPTCCYPVKHATRTCRRATEVPRARPSGKASGCQPLAGRHLPGKCLARARAFHRGV